MPRFRKKPVVIEARQIHPADSKSCNCRDLADWVIMEGGEASVTREGVEIRTLEGEMKGEPLDWVIKGVAGEFYPCKDSIFRSTYEPVE